MNDESGGESPQVCTPFSGASRPAIKAFFGDREREFLLTPLLITELERLTGLGVGALAARLFRGEFHLAHVQELIRLALIGGGEQPQDAAALVAVYTAEKSLSEHYSLAVSIMSAAWFGPEGEDQA